MSFGAGFPRAARLSYAPRRTRSTARPHELREGAGAVRIFKYAMYGICALIAIALVRGLFLSSSWSIARSVTIHAEASRIVPCLTDVRRWPEWMAWNRARDPSAEFTFSGEGVGSMMRWSGKKLGKNRLTLTAIDAASGVEYELCLAGRDEPSRGSLRVEADPARAADSPASHDSTVVWRDAGDVGWNPIYRWLVPVIEPALARDLSVSLERLKAAVEAAR
jgi:hypothetical protein